MKRVFQPALMRGHLAQNAALVMWVALLAVLVISLVRGMQRLQVS